MSKSTKPRYVIIHYDKLRGMPPITVIESDLPYPSAVSRLRKMERYWEYDMMTETAYERKYGKQMEQLE